MLHSVQHDKPFNTPLCGEAEERVVERSDDRVSLIFSVKNIHLLKSPYHIPRYFFSFGV